MADGRLGKSDLPAGVNTDVYTVPAGKVATANIWLHNRGAAEVQVRVAVRDGALSNSDYLEYDTVIPPKGVLEDRGIAMKAGEIVTLRTNIATVSARVHGFEENV